MQPKGSAFTGEDKDFLRFKLGSQTMIPGFEEAVRGMKVSNGSVSKLRTHTLLVMALKPTLALANLVISFGFIPPISCHFTRSSWDCASWDCASR